MVAPAGDGAGVLLFCCLCRAVENARRDFAARDARAVGHKVDYRAKGGLMYFDTFAEFMQMGKHGLYVWLAYGATGLVLLWSWMSARSMLAGVEKQLTEQAEITARGAKQTPAHQTSESGASDES